MAKISLRNFVEKLRTKRGLKFEHGQIPKHRLRNMHMTVVLRKIPVLQILLIRELGQGSHLRTEKKFHLK